MASMLSLHLIVPVCLNDFRDPVSLPSELALCRKCFQVYSSGIKWMCSQMPRMHTNLHQTGC